MREGEGRITKAARIPLGLTVRQTQSMPVVSAPGRWQEVRRIRQVDSRSRRPEAVATKLAATQAIPRGTPGPYPYRLGRERGSAVWRRHQAADARRSAERPRASVGRVAQGYAHGLPQEPTKVLKNQKSRQSLGLATTRIANYAENAAAKLAKVNWRTSARRSCLAKTKPARTAAAPNQSSRDSTRWPNPSD